jgi:hypothetical protein
VSPSPWSLARADALIRSIPPDGHIDWYVVRDAIALDLEAVAADASKVVSHYSCGCAREIRAALPASVEGVSLADRRREVQG